MALFQPMQQGPSGSAVTPKAEVQDTSVNSVLGFVEKAGAGLAGVFQSQEAGKQKAAVGTALTAYIEEQSRIADAVETGQLDPAKASILKRASFNKHAANNPLLLNEFLGVNKEYEDSQMGAVIAKGSRSFQEEQAKKMELQKQAAQDGFSDVNAWQNWEGQKRAWEAQDEFRKQKLYEAKLEAQRASTDASRRSAALSKARELEIETKLSHNQGLRTDLAGQLAGAQSTVEGIINMPATTEQKLQALQQASSQLKARVAGAYSFADQANIAMAQTQIDMIQKYAEDAVVQGKASTALNNAFNVATKERALELIGDNQFKNIAVMSSIFGQSFTTVLGDKPAEVAKRMVDIVVPPKDMKGPPPQMDKESWSTLNTSLKEQSKTEDSPVNQMPKKEVLENQIVNSLASLVLYGDGYSKQEDVEEAAKTVYGGAYEALKKEGSFNIPPGLRDQYSKFTNRMYEEAMLDMKNEYLDASTTSYKTVGGGIGQSVETEQQPSTKVITPTVENGVFKFVATDPSAGSEAARLNKTLAPAINNLAKMVAVGNGDPDLNKAIKELSPRLFEEEVPVPTPSYGKRADNTEKGAGYFGELKRPDGDVSTELSIGVDYGSGEKEIPTLVPTLTKEEVDHLLSGGEPTDAITRKAVEFAVQREKEGKPVFAMPGEIYQVPKE